MPRDLVTTAFKNKTDGLQFLWKKENYTKTFAPGVEHNTVRCSIQFQTPEDMGPPVLFYYHLTNFYQNHRRYVASFFDKQLKGTNTTAGEVNSSTCVPLTWNSKYQKPIYPCGLIANSMFNDTFSSPVLLAAQGSSDMNQTYKMQDNTNIAWASDASLYGKTSHRFDEVAPPPYWEDRYPGGYTETNPPPDLSQWQAFQVWMRTAGLPTFSKLYQRNDADVMKGGPYLVEIDDSE
jgi:hypothetical protein